MRTPGTVQLLCMRSMIESHRRTGGADERGTWSSNSGWTWDNQSGTTRVMESLVKAGWATREPHPIYPTRTDKLWQYRLTPEGERLAMENIEGKATNPAYDVGKLPKWAQAMIETLEREREAAVTALHNFNDSQTCGPVYYEEWVSDGTQAGPTTIRRYIQTDSINVHFAGIELKILLRKEGLNAAQPVIDVQYQRPGMYGAEAVVLQPRSFNQVYLFVPVAKDTQGV